MLKQALKKLVGEARTNNGRNTKTNSCIIDAQSVKYADTAEHKGYDAGKKVSGIKRHIAVVTQGLPHAIEATTANITDRDGAVTMNENAKNNLSEVKNFLVYGGYTGEKFAIEINKIVGASFEVVKRNELHKFIVLPKRWVVGRSFGWLEKCRRLWKNCYKSTNDSACFCFFVVKKILNRLLEQ